MNEKKESKDILSEILKWLRFIGKRQLRTLLLDALKEDVDMVVYELSNGRNLREIEHICRNNGYSIGRSTINSYWDKWKPLGIVEPSEKFQGRYERIVSLKEVGIEFPKIKLKKSEG